MLSLKVQYSTAQFVLVNWITEELPPPTSSPASPWIVIKNHLLFIILTVDHIKNSFRASLNSWAVYTTNKSRNCVAYGVRFAYIRLLRTLTCKSIYRRVFLQVNLKSFYWKRMKYKLTNYDIGKVHNLEENLRKSGSNFFLRNLTFVI